MRLHSFIFGWNRDNIEKILYYAYCERNFSYLSFLSYWSYIKVLIELEVFVQEKGDLVSYFYIQTESFSSIIWWRHCFSTICMSYCVSQKLCDWNYGFLFGSSIPFHWFTFAFLCLYRAVPVNKNVYFYCFEIWKNTGVNPSGPRVIFYWGDFLLLLQYSCSLWIGLF